MLSKLYFKGRNFRGKKLSRFRGFLPFSRKFLPRNFPKWAIRESFFPRNVPKWVVRESFFPRNVPKWVVREKGKSGEKERRKNEGYS